MINLITEREIVPELIQNNFTAENVVRRLRQLIPEGNARAEMLHNLQEVGEKLRFASKSAGQTAIERAARAAAELVSR